MYFIFISVTLIIIFYLGGKSTKRKWDTTIAQAKAGDFENIDPELYLKYYSTLKRINVDEGEIPSDLPFSTQARNFWYYGKTGTGKSLGARRDFPDHYLKIANNKWWDGYKKQPAVILEDFDKSHSYMGFNLKIWGDLYSFPVEIKGSALRIRPENIIVTSNWHPNQIWTDDETLEPILRRFRIVHFQTLTSTPAPQSAGEEVRAAYVPGFIPPPILTRQETSNSLADLDFLDVLNEKDLNTMF